MGRRGPEDEAVVAAHLLCSDFSWVRRRKVRLELLDELSVRIQHSVDFAIPKAALDGLAEDDPVYLPLFVLQKARRRQVDFDFGREDGTALSLPTRAENTEFSENILKVCAHKVLDDELGLVVLPTDVRDLLHEIATGEPAESLDACDRLLEPDARGAGCYPRPTLAQNSQIQFLARLTAWSSVVWIPVPREREGGVYKLQYTDDVREWEDDWTWGTRTGLRPLRTAFDFPFVGGRSFHLEVHPPAGMISRIGQLLVLTDGDARLEEGIASGRVMHMYVSDAQSCRSALAITSLTPQRVGLIDGARLACLATLLVLILSVTFAGRLASSTTSSAALLSLPGLLATYVLQPTKHPLTARVLRGVRWCLMVCAAAAWLSAFVLLIAPARHMPTSPKSSTAFVERAATGQAAAVASLSQDSSSDLGPSPTWLRVSWGTLAMFVLAATLITHVARRRAEP